MLIERILDATVLDAPAQRTIHIANGLVAPEPAMVSPDGPCLHANGRVVLPGFVDAHVHLDKAFLLEDADSSAPTLGTAIRTVADLRATIPLEKIARNAERAIELLIKNGTVAVRAHVEIDPSVGLDLVDLHQALSLRFADRIGLQFVAFPQRGFDLPGVTELTTQAMAAGLEVVGGAPYVDADPERHLDIVFSLAERFGAPIDLHLDFSDDPSRSLLSILVERVRAHGMQGLVTIGHVTTLSQMSADEQARALGLLAGAGIALVALPATDLYLAGHGEPGIRSLAPVERARAAGVRVAIANNNIQNPFAPFGNGNLLQAAWLSAITLRAHDPAVRRHFLDAITTEPGVILGLPEHGPKVGAYAHLAIADAFRGEDVLCLAPPITATLRAGRVVHSLGT